MTHPIPQPGRYREKDTDLVLLGRFRDDYEEVKTDE